MDTTKLGKGLGIGFTCVGIVGGILSVIQTIDEIKNGVKLRDEQLESITAKVSDNVSTRVTDGVTENLRKMLFRDENGTELDVR